MEKIANVNRDNLNDVMEFDHVIRVHKDGTVSHRDGKHHAPDLTMEVDEDGQSIHADDSDIKRDAESSGWELLSGWTGQQGYRGPVMHPSEYIGGRLADHILETPGYYVVTEVRTDDPEDEEGAGWAIAYRPAYKYRAAQEAEESGYGDEAYWQMLDDHTDELLAKGYDVREQSLGEALAGNDGD
ncbi:hypothetical protein SEA_ATUIN_14 [Arthrobacter phage Atuin]|nr:hypothetical protein SEA_ATUIN_113 [Arthrobacter phage Atuin]